MMGSTSSSLSNEEIDDLRNETSLSARQITNLYKRFVGLDKSHKGTISPDDLLSIPGLAVNPLAPRILALFKLNKDEDGLESGLLTHQKGNTEINFRQFVTTVSIFGHHSPRTAKLKAAFRIYDIDCDDYISSSELFDVLQMMVGEGLTPDQLQTVVEETMREADTDCDGKLSLEDFAKAVGGTGLDQRLSVRF